MSVHQCPFCHGPIRDVPIEANLTSKQQKVFAMIVSAGPSGIEIDQVMKAFFKDLSPTTLRTHIHNINRTIYPARIERHGPIFRFVLDKT